MRIQSILEIDFHQQDQVSIFLECTAVDSEEKFGELLLFSCFVLRTFINLGDNSVSDALMHQLISTEGNLNNMIRQNNPNEPEIISYPGSKGRKRFTANLRIFDNESNFQYNAKGFGFLAKGVGYYAPNAVLVLMKYLAKRRLSDANYIEALEKSAKQCGLFYNSNQLSITNQGQIAFMIAGSMQSILDKGNICEEKIKYPNDIDDEINNIDENMWDMYENDYLYEDDDLN